MAIDLELRCVSCTEMPDGRFFAAFAAPDTPANRAAFGGQAPNANFQLTGIVDQELAWRGNYTASIQAGPRRVQSGPGAPPPQYQQGPPQHGQGQ